MFSWARNPTLLLGILCDVTGSQKSEMAAANLEIRKSQFVNMLATNCYTYVFGVKQSNKTTRNTLRPNWELKIQYSSLQPEVPISQLIDKSSITCKRLYLYVFVVELFTMTMGMLYDATGSEISRMVYFK